MQDDARRFAALAASAYAELEDKQKRLETEYGIGTFARWHYDMDTALLRFFDADGRARLVAEFIDIGSFARQSHSWKWAWANQHVPPELREKASKLHALCASTGLAIFHQADAFETDEVTAWELAAIAVKHLGALGCYRAPATDGGLYLFLALMSIRTVQ